MFSCTVKTGTYKHVDIAVCRLNNHAMELRPYQVQAVEGVFQEWGRVRSTLLVMPTGTGKTTTFAEVVKRRPGRALVVAHRTELIEQAAQALWRRGIPASIEQAERRAKRNCLANSAVVASVQTLQGVRLQRWPDDAFETIVVDEAHHATAASYRRITSWFHKAKVLGVTATPDRADKVGLGHLFESVAFAYRINDAIKGGWLVPIVAQRVICQDLDISKVHSRNGDLAEGELQDALEVEAVLHQMADPLVRLSEGRQTIVFTAGVDQAKSLAEVLGVYAGPGRAAFVSGATPPRERARVLSDYSEGRIQYLVNCAVLTEGFDAPSTACVAMARPTKSRALFAQCVGRGLRLAPGKQNCLLIDFAGNAGTHSLVGPEDILAGDAELPEGVRKKVREQLEQGAVDLEEAIEEAEKRAVEERRLMELRQSMRKLKFKVDHQAEDVSREILRKEGDPPASDGQVHELWRLGVDKVGDISRAQAGKLINELQRRQREGLATYKQAKVLRRAGLDPNLSKQDASRAIDMLAANNWKASPQIRALYGPKPTRKNA